MEQKTCSRCKIAHPISEFRFDNIAHGVRKPRCRECENKRMREDRARHREKRRATENRRYRRTTERTAITNAMRRYGLTLEQAQRAACATSCHLCGRDNGTRRLNVDHCHGTGRVRGLLCDRCNLALGHLADEPGLIRRVADYIDAGGSGEF